MMKSAALVGASLFALFGAAKAQEACALDDPDFAPPANDVSQPAVDVVLMSIALDANGEFAIKSAKRANGIADYAWRLDEMTASLAPHATPAGATTPFDMTLGRDAIIVFRLEPGAWSWESDPARALFLKDGQRHDPFTAAEDATGRPHDFAVRFHAPTALGGCAYDYNLGVVVKQGGRKTPIIVDPKITNGGGGNG